jgi:hypothetical protein
VAAKGAGGLDGDELGRLFVHLPEVVAGPLQKQGVEERLLELYGDVPRLLSRREDGVKLLQEVCTLPPAALAELASSDRLHVTSENDVLVGCSGAGVGWPGCCRLIRAAWTADTHRTERLLASPPPHPRPQPCMEHGAKGTCT